MEITRRRIGSQIFVLSPVFGAFDTFVSSWDCGVSSVFGVSGTSGFSFVRLKVTLKCYNKVVTEVANKI